MSYTCKRVAEEMESMAVGTNKIYLQDDPGLAERHGYTAESRAF